MLVSCEVRDWPLQQPGSNTGTGGISLYLQGSTPTRSTTSTITKEEADLFLVTVTKGGEPVTSQVLLGSIPSLTFPVGYGYRVFVENITETEAESMNEGWGAKRYTGTSASFGIQAGQTTRVAVSCSVANAAVSIKFDDGLTDYVVTLTSGDRTLVTSGNNTAYFNVTGDTRTVTLRVEKGGRVITTQELELRPAVVKDVNLRPDTEGADIEGLIITYDDTFETVEAEITIE